MSSLLKSFLTWHHESYITIWCISNSERIWRNLGRREKVKNLQEELYHTSSQNGSLSGIFIIMFWHSVFRKCPYSLGVSSPTLSFKLWPEWHQALHFSFHLHSSHFTGKRGNLFKIWGKGQLDKLWQNPLFFRFSFQRENMWFRHI